MGSAAPPSGLGATAVLGSAAFIVTVDQSGLISGLNAAQQRAADTAAKLGASFADIEAASQRGIRGLQDFAKSLQDAANAAQKAADDEANAAKKAADEAERASQRQQAAAAQKAKAEADAAEQTRQAAVTSIAAFAGLTLSVQAARAAFDDIVEASQKAAQAQFQLSQEYGAAAGSMKANADALADSIGRGRVATEQAAANMAVLTRNFGLTTDQAKQLLAVSADLAAVTGRDVDQAAQAVTRSLEGQTRALELYGVVVTDKALKASGDLTDAQLENFHSLDAATKAQIVYGAILEKSAFAEGAAAARANDAAGAYDKMAGAVSNLEKDLGQAGGVLGIFSTLTTIAGDADKAVVAFDGLAHGAKDAGTALQDMGAILGGLPGAFGPAAVAASAIASTYHTIADEIERAKDAAQAFHDAGPATPGGIPALTGGRGLDFSASAPGGALDVDAEARQRQAEGQSKLDLKTEIETQATDARRLAEQNIETIRRQNEAEQAAFTEEHTRLEGAKAAHLRFDEDVRDSTLNRLKDEKTARDENLAHQKGVAEAARDAELHAASATKDGILASLDAQKKASDDAADSAIRALESQRNAALKAASESHDAAIAGIQAEQQATHDARQTQDRDLQISQQTEDRQRTAAHQAVLEQLAAEHTARDEALKTEETQITHGRDVALASIKDQQGAERDRATEAQRHLADEGRAAQDAHDTAIRGLQQEQSAEQIRHDQAIANIQRESDAQTQALQAQLTALDTADTQRAQKRQDQRNRQALQSAESGLRTAVEGGDPAAIRQAQQQVEAARQAQQDTAQQREEASQRASIQRQIDAIHAQADAQKKAQDETLKQAQDSTKAQEQAQNDALKAKQDAIAQEKQADSDRTATVLKNLQTEADATKATAQSQLDTLKVEMASEQTAYADRTKAVNASYQQQTQDIQDARQAAAWALQDQRQTEDRAYADRSKAINVAYKAEQDAIHLTYDDPVSGSISRLKEQKKQADETFGEQRKAAEASYKAQTDAVKAHYGTGNAETGDGVLDKIAQSKKASDTYYTTAADAAKTSYTAQKRAVDDLYTNAQKTGLIDQLDAAKKKAADTLINDEDSQVNQWRKWGEAIYGSDGYLTNAKKNFESFYDEIKSLGGSLGIVLPDRPDAQAQGRPPRPGESLTPGGTPTGQSGDHPTGGGPSTIVAGTVGQTIAADDGIDWTVKFPFKGKYSNPFNPAIPLHRGVDVAAPGPDNGRGTPYGAFQPGTVAALTEDPNGGHGIIIQTPGGLYNRYFHNDRVLVKQGQQVKTGDLIGVVGASGTEGFPHLHYEVSKGINGDPQNALIDPVPFMQGATSAGQGELLTLKPFGNNGPSIEIQATFGSAGVAGGTNVTPGDVADWIAAGLAAAHKPASWAGEMEHIVAVESGQRTSPPGGVVLGSGSPTAVNPEAVAGQHASGLMQMLPSTFEANRVRTLPDDIFDPIANVASAANYIAAVYGDPSQTPYYRGGSFHWEGVAGYASGGPIPKPTLLVGVDDLRPYAIAGERGPERVVPGTAGGNQYRFYGPVNLPISAGPVDAFNELSMVMR